MIVCAIDEVLKTCEPLGAATSALQFLRTILIRAAASYGPKNSGKTR